MYPDEPLRVCTHDCRIPHYENCPKCVGFGMLRRPNGELTFATAGEAHRTDPMAPHLALEPCPVCGSTITGIPKS